MLRFASALIPPDLNANGVGRYVEWFMKQGAMPEVAASTVGLQRERRVGLMVGFWHVLPGHLSR